MELYGQKSKSIPEKIVIHLIEILFLWLSYRILFQNGGNWCNKYLHIQNAADGFDRRVIIFSFNIITFFRLAYMMFFLLKRKIAWEESISVPFAFALYYIGYALLVLPVGRSIDNLDYCSIAVFFIGGFLNTYSEILRNIWKQNAEHKGQLYTGGFFKYSRHINYFGDLLWVTAYALITRNWYAVSIPVFLFCFFAFYNAPKLDKYLYNKYGHAFERYSKTTKMLIPFIY